MKQTLILFCIIFSFNQVNAKTVYLPKDFVAQVSFDRDLIINDIRTDGSTSMHLIKDIEINGVKVFERNDLVFAKVSYQPVNTILLANTGYFGKAQVTIPEITIYDTLGRPAKFALSESSTEIKIPTFKREIERVLDFSKAKQKVVSKSEIFYAFNIYSQELEF